MSSSSSFCDNKLLLLLLSLLLSISTTFLPFNHVFARPNPGCYAYAPLTKFISDTKLVSYEKEMQEVAAELITPISLPAALFERDNHDVFIPSSIAENPVSNDSNTSTNFNWKKTMPWLLIIIMLLSGCLSVHIYCHFCQPASATNSVAPATARPAHTSAHHDIELSSASQPGAISN